jgi:hypothetical protein
LTDKFEQLCRLIVRGDYIAFREYLSPSSPAAEWFARKGILLTLRNRCEIMVWRSFCRKVFIHSGFHGDLQAQAQRGPPPYLYLEKLTIATRWLQSQHGQTQRSNGVNHATSEFHFYGSQIIPESTDPDFGGLDGSETPTAQQLLEKYGDYLAPDGFFDGGGHWQDNMPGQLIDGNPGADYDAFELNPYAEATEDGPDADKQSLLMDEVESILASLLTQGLMRGYLTHRNPRFAIPGSRVRGALPTGFPNIWETIFAREREDDSVPGWVRPPPPGALGAGGGRVVNLSGARPVGVQ